MELDAIIKPHEIRKKYSYSDDELMCLIFYGILIGYSIRI